MSENTVLLEDAEIVGGAEEVKKGKKKLDAIGKLIKESVFTAAHLLDKERRIISVSPCLDDLLGGGITSGSLVIVRGQYKAGKTTTCLHFCKNAQKAGFKIVYLDIEARLTQRDLLSIPGLDLSAEKFELCAHSEGNILSGEDFIAVGEHKLKTEKNVVVVFDSFSQLISQDNMNNDIRDRTRDSMPLTLSKFCKRALPALNVNDNICIGITHDIANTGPGMATKIEASGRKIQYANSFKIAARWATEWTEGETVVGQDIHWECENSALGPPNRTAVGKLRYNQGLDEVAELVELAILSGCHQIRKGGAWFEVEGKEAKINGIANTIEYLKTQPELCERIKAEVKERLAS
jgi:recombination protein RecA